MFVEFSTATATPTVFLDLDGSESWPDVRVRVHAGAARHELDLSAEDARQLASAMWRAAARESVE